MTPSDIPALTEICRLGMQFDEWFQDVLAEKTVLAKDYDPDLTLVAEEEGREIGFVAAVTGKVRGEKRGWVRLLVVHPAFQCRGAGSLLLKEIEKQLTERGIGAISIMDVPANYYMPGVDVRYKEAFCFLEKNGYVRGIPNINLLCDVSPDIFPYDDKVEKLKEDGFIIRRAEKADWTELKKFLLTNWECWVAEAANSYDNDPVTLYICEYQSKVVGFSGYEGNNRRMGWFGPMGVDPITRGKGIGALLCLLCLRDIALLGHRKAIIPWVGPVRFYDKVCGADMDRTFWTFSKKLS